MKRVIYVAAILALVFVWGRAEREGIEATEEIRRMTMPPATAFEEQHELLRLTVPVRCERLPGVEGMGEQWIRQWGDGALPTLVPTCVRAVHYGRMVFL